MEAKLIRYGAEQITNAAGQIAVTATKEEWGAVIDEILRGGWEPNKPSSSLVHWLINQGVYE